MAHRKNQKYKARRRQRVAWVLHKKIFGFDRLGYYDRRGQRIPAWRWHQLLSARQYRVVGSTEVGPIRVSTVWLGLDHGICEREPIIFETMLFRAEAHRALDWQDRYCTLAAAQLGHAATVARLRSLGPAAIERLLEIRDWPSHAIASVQ